MRGLDSGLVLIDNKIIDSTCRRSYSEVESAVEECEKTRDAMKPSRCVAQEILWNAADFELSEPDRTAFAFFDHICTVNITRLSIKFSRWTNLVSLLQNKYPRI